MFVAATGNKHILSFQTKYTLIDEQDIPLVENYAFEVQEHKIIIASRQVLLFYGVRIMHLHYLFSGTHGGRC